MQKGHDQEFYGKDEEDKIYPIYAIQEKNHFLSFCPLCSESEMTLIIDEAKGTMRCRQCDRTLKIVEKEKIMPKEPEIEKEKKAARERTKKKRSYQASIAPPAKKKRQTGGKFVKAWPYVDEKGKLLFEVCKYVRPDKTKYFWQRQPDKTKKGGWIWNLKGTRRVLYRLPELRKSKGIVLIPEGEKDCDLGYELGYASTCNPMGAGKWKPEYSVFLSGRDVVLIPDLAPEGIEHMKQVGNSLARAAKSIKWLELPGKDREGSDLSNWYEKIGDKKKAKHDLARLIEKAPDFEPEKAAKVITGKKFNPRSYSDYILANYHLKYDSRRRFWWYDPIEGIWKDSFPLKLNDILRKGILKRQDLKRNRVAEILEDLKGLAYQEEVPPEPDNHLIPFKNKIYDLRDGKLLDFGPGYFFINKLNVNYDPKNKKCPRIQKIFEQIIRPEDVITLFEIIAYSFFRGYPYPKSFMLFGGGANGKSTFARIMSKILGRQNIASASLNTLELSPFGTSQLYGKLANISPEMAYGILRSANVLKQLTGQDLVKGERKFKDPFEFENYAKLIFLSNEIPFSADKSFAFYRRIFLLEFPRRFEIAKGAQPFIIERIPKKEFEGLAYKCLEILKDLSSEKRLFTFTRHKKTEDVMMEYERISDPLAVFLEERTEIDPEQNIPVRGLNEEFKKYQKEKGLRVWNDKLISKVMSQKGIIKRTVRLSASIEGEYNYYKAYLELNWRTEKS